MNQTTAPIVSIVRDERTDEQDLLSKLKALLSIDFDEHDTRLLQCLHSATLRIEKHTGLLLEPATVTAQWDALYDYEALPYGPVTGAVTVTDLTGSALAVNTLSGGFPVLRGNYARGIKLVYKAGYTANTLPEDLAESVLNLAANGFDNGNRDWMGGVRANSRYTWAS